MKALRVWGWPALAATLALAFQGSLRDMWARWFPAWNEPGTLYQRLMEGESYYTHGPLVPVISLIIAVLLVRHTRVPVRPRPVLGAIALSGALLANLAGVTARINFVSGFAFVAAVAAVVLLVWGGAALRRLWFPIAFLAFMVPLPEVTVADLNFRLKMMSAGLGVHLAAAAGVIAERVGNQVVLAGGKSLVVANVCNGLRTLISLLAFGALYVYVCRLRGLWRVGLFAMAVPVAVAANAVRIVALIVVADIWSPDLATGFFHDVSGLAIFVLAFVLMFGLEKLVLGARRLAGRPAVVTPLFDDCRRTPADARQTDDLLAAVRTRRFVFALAALALTAGATLVLGRTVVLPARGGVAAGAIPATFAISGSEWVGYDQTLDRRTLMILETNDYLLRTYVASGRPPVELCIVFSADNRKGTHPPDLCLEGGGSDIVLKNDLAVGDLPCRELVVRSGDSAQYILYTYKCGDDYTASFWRQQYVIFVNGLLRRNASGALIRVSMRLEGDDEAQAARRARDLSSMFLAGAQPYLTKLP
jgi:EpsI family protein